MSKYEKSHLQSKKFAAFFWDDLTWTVLIGGGLALLYKLVQSGAEPTVSLGVISLLLGMVIVKGFGQALYIGGQAALDKYVRVAEIVKGGDDPPPTKPPEAN